MTAFDAVAAAAELQSRRARRVPAGPLPDGLAPRDEAQAAAVQVALFGATAGADARPAGFKVGATGTRMQQTLGIAHPAAAPIAVSDLHASGARLAFANLFQVAVECEIAVRLLLDLPPGPCTVEEARGAVGGAAAAIEIVENRYGPPPIGDVAGVGVPTMVADGFYHAAAVAGEIREDWRELDLRSVQGRLLLNGQERATGQGAELLGDPLRVLAWLAGSPTAAAFGGLRAGQIVLLGSVTPPLWLDAPGHVEVIFDQLGAVAVTLD